MLCGLFGLVGLAWVGFDLTQFGSQFGSGQVGLGRPFVICLLPLCVMCVVLFDPIKNDQPTQLLAFESFNLILTLAPC